MHRVWKKFVHKHRGTFTAELKFKKDFSVRTRFCFTGPIYFIMYLNGFMMTLFSPEVSAAGTGQQYMCILCYGEPLLCSWSSEDVHQMAEGSK